MISENNPAVPENTTSKKRGRPSLITPELHARIGAIYPGLTTTKSLQNKLFGIRAIHLIRNKPGLEWLYDRRGHYIYTRETILSELGRVKNDNDLLSLAREVCESKPTSREAVRTIRNWRFRKDS